jgi:hypothetical protein
MTSSTASSALFLLAVAGCGRDEPAPSPSPPPRAALDPATQYQARVDELERDREDLLAALLVATGPAVRCGRVAAGGAEVIVFLPDGPRGLVVARGLAAEPAGGRYVAWARPADGAWQPLGDLQLGLGLPGHRLVFLRDEPAPAELAISVETEARPAAPAAPVATVTVGAGC